MKNKKRQNNYKEDWFEKGEKIVEELSMNKKFIKLKIKKYF